MSKEKLAITIFGIGTFGVVLCGVAEAVFGLIKTVEGGGAEVTLSYGGLAGVLIICSAYYLAKLVLER